MSNNKNTLFNNKCEADSSVQYTNICKWLELVDEKSISKLESLVGQYKEDERKRYEQIMLRRFISALWYSHLRFKAKIVIGVKYYKNGELREMSNTYGHKFNDMKLDALEKEISRLNRNYRRNPHKFIDQMFKKNSVDPLDNIEEYEDIRLRLKQRYDEGATLFLYIDIGYSYMLGFKPANKHGVVPGTFKPKTDRRYPIQTTDFETICYLRRSHNEPSRTSYRSCSYTVDQIVKERALFKRFAGIHFMDYNDHMDIITDMNNERIEALKNGKDSINIYQFQRDYKREFNIIWDR